MAKQARPFTPKRRTRPNPSDVPDVRTGELNYVQPYPLMQEHAAPDDRAAGFDKYADWREAYNDPWGGLWHSLGAGYDPEEIAGEGFGVGPATVKMCPKSKWNVSDQRSESGEGLRYEDVGIERAVSIPERCPT